MAAQGTLLNRLAQQGATNFLAQNRAQNGILDPPGAMKNGG